jgi:hypothetical protein
VGPELNLEVAYGFYVLLHVVVDLFKLFDTCKLLVDVFVLLFFVYHELLNYVLVAEDCKLLLQSWFLLVSDV